MAKVLYYEGTLEKSRFKDAAFDLEADGDFIVEPNTTVKIPTKVSRISLPEGTVGLVSSRSGLALNSDFIVFNAPGVIDENYRSTICVIGRNFGDKPLEIKDGDRIAQLLILELAQGISMVRSKYDEHFAPVDDRGEQGFGSSGVSKVSNQTDDQLELEF